MLSFVIADEDREYTEKLEKFLIIHYPKSFEIFSFSSPDKLSEFLDSNEKRDILLISSAMYKKGLQFKNIAAVIMLCDNSMKKIPYGVESVKKYQQAQRLVTDILEIYSSKSQNSGIVAQCGKSRVVCVYSTAGGAGKTTIAAGCSMLSAERGLKTFYLNLEEAPSTNLYFDGESDKSFSNAIYYLKGKEQNLSLKLEGAKCCDSKSGVHFFSPPDNILEMEELTEQDAVCLVNEFKTGADYDNIFIDMSCGLNKRNVNILGCADIILLVFDSTEVSSTKAKEMLKGFEVLEHKYGIKLRNKSIAVLNKLNKGANTIGPDVFIEGRPVVKIEAYAVQDIKDNARNIFESTAFLSSLSRLLDCFISREVAGEYGTTGYGIIGYGTTEYGTRGYGVTGCIGTEYMTGGGDPIV